MTDDIVVDADHVSRSFRSGPSSVEAVVDVTLSVSGGARVALVGPSGSGKSTLLHLLAGLDTPTTGTVAWPATSPTRRVRPHLVGIVFQGPSLVGPLNALENVALVLQLADVADDEAQDRARSALDRLGLGAVASKFPDELSGGQMQRVAIARALAGNPRLLLADEPTGQLDHVSANTVMDALLDAADHIGAGLVVSTHDPTIAARLPTRWTMADGRLSIEASITC